MNSLSKAPKESKSFDLKVHKSLFQWIKDSRWRNKCKKSINRARYQILVHRNRTKCIIRQSRMDIAQLINLGHDLHQAFPRVENLHYDEARLLAYSDLEDLLVKIEANLSQFARKVDDLDLEIHEAVSSVVLAASLCAELPELRRMRELFARWFGDDFRRLTENFVNCRIKYKLSERSVSDDVKLWLVAEISKEYSINIDQFEVVKRDKYQEDDGSTRIVVEQVMKPCIEPFSIIQDKNKQSVVATKRSMFREVFRMMRSNFSLQARSSNLVTPHRDSFDAIPHVKKAVNLENYEKDNRTIACEDSFEEKFIELKDQYNVHKSPSHSDISHVEEYVKNTYETIIYKRSSRELKDESRADEGNIVHTDNEDDKVCDGAEEMQRLSYVHPNLPDYDELVATFTQYKKELKKDFQDENDLR